jgi:hypothetical protein
MSAALPCLSGYGHYIFVMNVQQAPSSLQRPIVASWFPAFAGMTMSGAVMRGSTPANDGPWDGEYFVLARGCRICQYHGKERI